MNSQTFASRRAKLRKDVPDGAILILGQKIASRTYPANPYPFRQSSHFLYYTGLNAPDLALLMLPGGEEILFGLPEDPDDLIWHGPHPSIKDFANDAGIGRTEDIGRLKATLGKLKGSHEIHYTPPIRGDQALVLGDLLDVAPAGVGAGASMPLARAIVEQRSIKTDEEVAEIEEALEITAKMYEVAFRLAGPGKVESEVAGAMQGVALAHDSAQSFCPIVSIRGEVLHNESYLNTMNAGDLLLIDSGNESKNFYASDITRTIPVSGTYSEQQRGVYQTVLNAQLAAIEATSPAISNRDAHLIAARTITEGLKSLGLMKGDVDEAVNAGAHALFFCHGLGHMLGLDAHDMEDLGDVVGYPEDQKRSKQFGLSFLRLAKKLKPGFVITFEPGVYFVPALIDRWKAEKKHEAFIDYKKLEEYRGFGGVRIEDDILITEDGCRVLGPGIPKTIEEVEESMKK